LRDGHFDVAGWHSRQITTGRTVELLMPDGSTERVRAVGVDGTSGALIVEGADGVTGEREVMVGEIAHVRVDDGPGVTN
jgi:hypothetical protein